MPGYHLTQGSGAVLSPLQSSITGLVRQHDVVGHRGYHLSIPLQGGTPAKRHIQLGLDVTGALSSLNLHRVMVPCLSVD